MQALYRPIAPYDVARHFFWVEVTLGGQSMRLKYEYPPGINNSAIETGIEVHFGAGEVYLKKNPQMRMRDGIISGATY